METPETDAAILSMQNIEVVYADFARRLERERNDLKLQLEKLRDVYVDLCDLHFENMKGN